ncbi:YceI family protein [Nonomuraea roseoviolacea]|uniref:Polyisoprenoid-binding protein YceI n=1 Tax=Nonomuraea roseoviolacea subsp. carminata TaxID=160689 RepID=A0ABT1JX34_9ACTN|nr:YceI family protein [Nonomuraea roseoviolacea]MCP2346316.1 polyisoprenoid-binding protein YceI [Nonomuraea roseoviolacea subsp. carminata]
MGITAGSYPLGPESGRLLVTTTRAGFGAKAGHDLTIEVTRWRGEATIDPADPAGSSVTVEVDAGSFEVREGTGGVKPLTASDRAEIEKNIREKVLYSARHPVITFRSSRVEGTAESFRVEGDLTMAGATRPVVVEGSVAGGRVTGSAVVVQSRWGIRPYSAFLGALKVGDEVGVRFDVGLVPAP